MALILIVEHDESQARFLTHALQQAGHTPMLAPNGFAALLGVRAQPDLILLDMGLPNIPADELFRRLKRQPDTAGIPVMAVTEPIEAGGSLPRTGAVEAAAILRKPVSAAALREAVNKVLCRRTVWDTVVHDRAARQRAAILYRLICNGSDSLVFQICHRLEVDRARVPEASPGEPLTWPEIVRWAKREALLHEGEAQTLLQDPAASQLLMKTA